MTLDELGWNPEATGVGSLLMIEPGLPRDEAGRPYQPIFWFAEDSRLLGLVVDAEDHVLAWAAELDVADPDGWQCRRVPEAIEQAARDWWAAQETAEA
jgi:hypothetical protein